MAPCNSCERDLNSFSPACLLCGRRYIRDLKRMELPTEEKVARLRKVLADWMSFGHAEDELREPISNKKGG